MSEKVSDFHDPDLKAALQRSLGGHRAPAGRRDALEKLLAAESQRRSSILSFWRPVIAVAASIAIVAGGVAFYVHHRHEQEEYEEYYVANETLYHSMIAAHRSNAVIGDPVETLEAAKFASLQDRLKRYIPEIAAVKDGYAVQSIQICRTSNGEGAIVHLAKDKSKLTFITLPVADYKNAEENEPYQYTVDGQPVAGVAIKGGIHCVVGDPGVSAEQLRDLAGFIHDEE